MKTAKTEKRRRFAAIDALIIILLMLCVAGIAVRTVTGSVGLFSGSGSGSYLVSYSVSGLRGDYSEYFTEGKEFFLENGDSFGVLSKDAVFTPARLYGENSDGVYVASYATDGRVDVKGTAVCRGKMTDNGFMLGGKVYAAANSQFTISSGDIKVTITVTDIAKAQ